MAQYDELSPNDLPDKIRKTPPIELVDPEPDLDSVLPLELMETRYIEKVLALAAGNKSLAARLLGLDRRTLYRRLDRLGHAVPEANDEESETPSSHSALPERTAIAAHPA